jgi:hypothetical protein
VEDTTFCGCTSLESVIIPDGVTSIGINAFKSCAVLKSITIPDSVTDIGSFAFGNCTSLTSIVIPKNVLTIGLEALSGCKSLINIIVDENNTAYKSVDGDLYTKDGLTLIQYAIGKTATSFVIPDSVTSIGEFAFKDCSSLTSITVDENNTAYKSIDGNLYSKDGKTLIQYAIRKTATSFVIPDSVTSIGEYAFSWCYRLTSVTIPDSVTSIGKSAFYSCSSLTSVSFAENSKLTSIGDKAFSSCSKLTSITIPNSVTRIGDRAFEDCDSLTSITIPNSVTSIGYSVFSGCSALTSIKYRGTEEQWEAISKENANIPSSAVTYNYTGE